VIGVPVAVEGQTEQNPAGGDGNSGDTPPAGGSEFKAPASQEELNRVIADRLAREKAKFDRELEKYKDVPDLRKKADEYDKLVESQKTEQERILARAEAAEAKAAALEAAEQARVEKAQLAQQVADWKTKIAADPKFAGVPASALRGSTEEELREHAAELKALIPEVDARRGAYVPSEGRHTGSGSTDARAEFANILHSI
jgi:hypothetical protein